MSSQKLTQAQVEHVAKLAKLDLTASEINKFSSQLSEILNYISKLNEVDTKDIEPTFNVTGLCNVMSEDETEPGLPQDKVLQNAKSKENGFFKVKAILG